VTWRALSISPFYTAHNGTEFPPIPTNTRAAAARIFDLHSVAAEEPWQGD